MKKNKKDKNMKKPVKAKKASKAPAKPKAKSAKPKYEKKKTTKPAKAAKSKPVKPEKVKPPKKEKIKKEKPPKPEKAPKLPKLPKLRKTKVKTKKEVIELPPPPDNKKRISLEYVVRSSPVILYDFVSNPSNMAQWFADSVDSNRGIYTFKWDDGTEREARVIDSEPAQYIKYQWLTGHPGEFFEFRITHTEITGDTVLTITDFSDPLDYENDIDLWKSQIHEMLMRMGS